MNHPTLAIEQNCTGCLACVDSCNHGALHKIIGEDGHIYVECDTDKCVLCHLCEKTCPVVSDYNYQGDGQADFYAAWNKDREVRKRSASGGAFSAIATYLLDQGGYVIGASNEGVCDIKHICIHSKEELPRLQGSKYTQSDASGIYKETYQLLKNGELVLFSGTGCQVAGLLSFLGNRKYPGKLATVDLICGGVASKLLIETFLKNEPYKIKKIVSFRTKDTGWKSHGFRYNMKVVDEEGKVHDYTGIKNLVTDGFCSEMTDRFSCYDCKFAGKVRKSDFTIGDLWGDTEHQDEHFDGVSLIVAHTPDATQLLKDMKDNLFSEPTSSVDAIKHNYRLTSGRMKGANTFERKHLGYLFKYLSYISLKHLYGNDIENTSPWMLHKVFRKIRIKLS